MVISEEVVEWTVRLWIEVLHTTSGFEMDKQR